MITTQPEQPWRVHVLIVEDDGLQREILSSALAQQGYEVGTAADGLDAVRKVRESSYDLVIIDYHLPEIDGFATARLIRDFMKEACPALIALTMSPNHLTEREAVSGGAFDGIIAKPIRLSDLISVVECCLNATPNRAARRAAEAALFEKNWADYDAAPARPDGENGQPAPPRILVVEDDELQRTVLRSILESNGYVAETVSDGMQAIRMIHAGAYDLVLVDYRLPEIDGLAVARLILDLMNEDVRPRMIALTAAPGHLSGRQTDTGSAFDEVVAKSSDFHALLITVARQLRSSPISATRKAMEVIYPSAADGQRPPPAAMNSVPGQA